MKTLYAAFGLATLILMSIPALAQSQTEGTMAFSSSEQETRADTQVLAFIHGVNLAEIKVAGFAETHAANEQVKTYARRLVRNHRSAEKALDPVAKQVHVTLADATPPSADDTIARLQTLTGPAFDRAFLSDMSSGHQNALDTLAIDRGPVGSKTVLTYVDNVIATVKKHKAAADALLAKAVSAPPTN